MAAKPSGPAEVRMYNVGFGDCFLLSVPYTEAAGGKRHVLIDYGSSGKPDGAPAKLMRRIAENIQAHVAGQRFAVVATHRHRDHINGFDDTVASAGGDIIAGMHPEVVVQPWTEDLDAPENATTLHSFRAPTRRYLRGLTAAHAFAAQLTQNLDDLLPFAPRAVRRQLAFIGENNTKNVDAVKNLATMGTQKPVYTYCGRPSGLTKFLPGVKVHVLGPPTVQQYPEIASDYADESDEYWLHRAKLLRGFAERGVAGAGRGKLFPRARTVGIARARPHVRWFLHQLQEAALEQVRAIVTDLEDQMNNTSLILVFEIGGKTLLFPGDAQLENWTYALTKAAKREKYKALLNKADVYKVGHHGSRNATPKAMVWQQLLRQSSATGPNRLVTFLSTREGQHGTTNEVPKQALVTELKARSDLHSTLEAATDGTPEVVVI